VIEVAVRLGRLVHLLDQLARPTGTLPATLDPVLQRFPDVSGRDLWGRTIRYSPSELQYELRSAGPDGEIETSDDIVSLGRLGRVLPCETRHGFGSLRFEDSAPPCSGVPVLLVPPCPELMRSRVDVTGEPSNDPNQVTGKNLIRYARQVDGHGRNMGALPVTLRQVVSNRDLVDSWGRPVRYTVRGRGFDLSSAGADGSFGSSDDIIVEGVLGRTIPCSFSIGNERFACDDPPPACPEGEIRRG
jgi:hypothetical protein